MHDWEKPLNVVMKKVFNYDNVLHFGSYFKK